MGGCAAFGCPNRSEHGFCFKAFPKDPHRRAVWAARVNRKNWEPTDSSRLCEMHFEPCMWEVDREDGRRKLKMDAVPTIFSFQHVTKKIKLPVLRKRSETLKRMVHYEPSMWEVDKESGKRKLKADAVPSLSFVKRVKLPTPISPQKILSDHSYIKCDESVADSLNLPFNLMPEIYVLDASTTSNDDVVSSASSVPTKLRTYCNKRKLSGSAHNKTIIQNNFSCENSETVTRIPEKSPKRFETSGSTANENFTATKRKTPKTSGIVSGESNVALTKGRTYVRKSKASGSVSDEMPIESSVAKQRLITKRKKPAKKTKKCSSELFENVLRSIGYSEERIALLRKRDERVAKRTTKSRHSREWTREGQLSNLEHELDVHVGPVIQTASTSHVCNWSK